MCASPVAANLGMNIVRVYCCVDPAAHCRVEIGG